MEHTFVVGDAVRLKPTSLRRYASQNMTIRVIANDGEDCICEWFDSNLDLHKGAFPMATLEPVDKQTK